MLPNSDCYAHHSRFNTHHVVHTKEREDSLGFHKAMVVQILEHDWIKVRWDWTGFSPGSTSIVHESWIRDDNASRPRQHTHYNYDHDICINCASIGRDRFYVRVPYNDAPAP